MEEIVIQPRRRTFAKAAIVLFSIISVVGVTFFIYTRQVLDKTTVIKGITVPPEPDPTANNATLAGVDSNSNGVRDDVERMIAREVSSASGFTRALVVARAYQRFLATTTVSQADSDTSMLEVECSAYRNLTDPTGIKNAEIKRAVFNTAERLEDLRKKALYLNPRITDTKHECEVGHIEVINGISVPPEPDPAINDATLAGVDANSNGVRDDVERVIAGASKKSTYDAQTLPIGRLYNKLAISRLDRPEDVADVIRQIYCFDIKRTASERQTISAEDIKRLTNNTSERVSIANANDTLLATKSALVEKGFTCN